MENEFGNFFSKKAYEIAYAIFRSIGEAQGTFGEHLKNQSLTLLSTTIEREYVQAYASLDVIEHFLSLGTSVGLLQPRNIHIIAEEVKNLKSAILEFGNSAKLPHINLEGAFSHETVEDVKQRLASEEKNTATVQLQEKRNTQNVRHANQPFSFREEEISSLKSANRQSAILEKIRQIGNCRLKDLQEFLPGVSERTLRYDLQALIERGVVERVGNAGPSTYYQLKTVVDSPIALS